MCTAVLSMGLTALGTYQNYQAANAQADAQAKQYEYQAQVAEQNAALANRQAESNAESGAMKAQQVLQRAKQVKAAQAAAYSANGVDVSSGSALDILSDTEAQGQLDKANMLYDAANNTWSLQSQAVNYQNQAAANRSSANNAREAGKMNSMSALLTGVSSLAGQYNSFSNTGAISQNSTTGQSGYKVPTDSSGNYFISGKYNDFTIKAPNNRFMTTPKKFF